MRFSKVFEDIYLPFILGLVFLVILYVWLQTDSKKEEGFSGTGPYYFEMYYNVRCPHCQRAQPEFEKLGSTQTIGGKEVICRMIDVKKNPEQLRGKVRGVPTIQLWDSNGKMVGDYKSGNRTSRGFVTWLKKTLGE